MTKETAMTTISAAQDRASRVLTIAIVACLDVLTFYVVHLLALVERDGGPAFSNSFVRVSIVSIVYLATLATLLSSDRKIHIPSMSLACGMLAVGAAMAMAGRWIISHGGM
jgi:hypothetical protein